MEKQIIYRDYVDNWFCWWSYNDRGKKEFMGVRAATLLVWQGKAVLVNTPKAKARMREIYRVKG